MNESCQKPRAQRSKKQWRLYGMGSLERKCVLDWSQSSGSMFRVGLAPLLCQKNFL